MSKEAYVEMKIKEKGLKGKAAVGKRDHITRKGFDAFREMRLAADKEGKKGPEKAPPEIFVSFLGKNLRVLDEGGGSVAPEEVPRVRGSALRFTGCGGEVSFDNIKRPLKERFTRAPFIKFTKGDDAGLVGFDKALDEEDVAFVREKIPTLNGNPVTWELPESTSFPCFSCFMRWKTSYIAFSEEEEEAFGIERANAAARRALGATDGSARGGRGGPTRRGRGGHGGRGKRADRNTQSRTGRSSDNRAQNNGGDEQVGGKRKRSVEPDGGHDAGVRGQAVPTVVVSSPLKKSKMDNGKS